MSRLLFIVMLFSSVLAYGQKVGYQIFTAKGKKTSFEKMLKQTLSSDILLFGEFHNNPISHWLQYELTDDAIKSKSVILGAEMFEADNQKPLNAYLAGEISDKQLDTLARLWPNYKTDYKPLVDLAKENKIPFIATNIPRRYASQVFRKGLESLTSLTSEELSWIAPLPIEFDGELPGYKNMMNMMGGDHANDNFPKAQAIRDATMSHFILENYKKGSLFIHYNGAYHSDNYEGILWYLKRREPNLRYMTISTVSQSQVQKLDKENLGRADFIIVVDEHMTTTY